ncbi:probable clathrin assembly protein At2g01600 at N-terminal half [Coccomyxa sp. Obi]|nr:probable clathrin assembly protein At2g01600 at N-terminal half [Coccomyxa sp. Obi]
MDNLTTIQSVKQETRKFMAVATDKMALASASVSRGETHDLDVAIIKATTSQFHVVPKEKHVRTLKQAVHVSRSRQDVSHVKMELLKRLRKASDWLTALKSLMVIHQLMRDADTSWLEELLKIDMAVLQEGKSSGPATPPRRGSQQRIRILDMDNFIDTTNIEGRFEFSEYVRAYGKYLDEQLEVFASIRFYQEQEQGGEQSRMRTLGSEELLRQLPVLQRLLGRLVDCRPTGAASLDPVVQGSLFFVLKESFKIYKAISEGLINLADKFFEMDYLSAQKGIEIYKEAIVSSERLQTFHRQVEQIESIRRVIQFPKLEPPPSDFLVQMENYAREAPRSLDDVQSKKRSPPLRRGSKVTNPRTRADTAHDRLSARSADPGMVIAFDKAADPAAKSKPQLDLLNFEDLSIDPASSSPMPAATPSSNGTPAKPTESTDYLSSLSDTSAFPSSGPSPADPFAPSTFGSTTTDGVRSSAASSNGQANIFAPSPVPAAAGRGRSANPFGPSAMNGNGGGFGGSAFAQPAAAASDGFGSSASFQNAHSGAAPSFSGALSGSYTPMPTPSGTGGFGSGALSPLGPAKTAPQSLPAAPGLYNKKEASVHDPFAELTGLKVEPPKASPPLKKLPGSSGQADRPATAPSPSTLHGSVGPAPTAQAAKFPAPATTAASESLHGGFATFPAANGIRDTTMPVQTDFKGSFDSELATNGSLI